MYSYWVRGAVNLADPIGRLHDQFDGDLALAREAATRRVGDLWAFPDRKTVFSMDPRRSQGSFCASAGAEITNLFV